MKSKVKKGICEKLEIYWKVVIGWEHYRKRIASNRRESKHGLILNPLFLSQTLKEEHSFHDDRRFSNGRPILRCPTPYAFRTPCHFYQILFYVHRDNSLRFVFVDSRPPWSSEEFAGVFHVASCRLPRAGNFDFPWYSSSFFFYFIFILMDWWFRFL